MRVNIEHLTPAQLESLSRTTRWRAQKRGWVCVGYNKKQITRDDAAFNRVAEAIYKEAEMVVYIAKHQGLFFPYFLDSADLIQECVIEVWRKSARAEFLRPGWRVAVMRGRLWDLRKSRRWEANLTTLERVI